MYEIDWLFFLFFLIFQRVFYSLKFLSFALIHVEKAINDLEIETDDVQELINSSTTNSSRSSSTSSSDDAINENEKDAQNIDEMIYSTPSNKLIERNNDTTRDIGGGSSSSNTGNTNDKNGNSNDSGDDRSVLRLVQHDDDSHDA